MIIVHENVWHYGNAATIVLAEGKALCHVSVDKEKPNEAFLSNLIVHETVRNQGLGNQLLAEAEKYAKEHGLSTMFLQTYTDAWCYEWYRRHGYEIFKAKYNNMIYLMKKLT